MLAQLGSRVQHQLRAHTPNDAKALKATVSTYPHSAYDDLGQVLTSLGIGEAVVTVMSEKGAPTPVAWTRLRAPESLMDPAPADQAAAIVAASPLLAKYGEAVQGESAEEMLAQRRAETTAAAEKAEAEKAEPKADAKKGGDSGRGGAIRDAVLDNVDDVAAAIAPHGKKQMARSITNALKKVFRR